MGNSESIQRSDSVENYWLKKVKNDPSVLCVIPLEILRSEYGLEMCLVAVKQFGVYLKFVPENHKTFQVCVEAVKNCKAALYYVPENTRDDVLQSANNLIKLELHKEDETKVQELLCVVCLEKKKRVRFDCGHVSTCIKCSESLDKCPVCRQRKVSPLIVYL